MEHGSSNDLAQVEEANLLLGAEAHLSASWWQYSASLSSFELLVGEANGKRNLVLVMLGCSYLSGPVAWGTQRLRVTMVQGDRDQKEFELKDEVAGFTARSKMFKLKANLNLLELGSVIFPRGAKSDA